MGFLTELEAHHRLAVQRAPEIILSTFQSSPGVPGTHSHTQPHLGLNSDPHSCTTSILWDELVLQPNNYILSEAIITPSSNGLGKCLLVEESTAEATCRFTCLIVSQWDSLCCVLYLFDCILMLPRLSYNKACSESEWS